MLGSNRPALSSKSYDVDDFAAAQELFHSNGWTDGLPVVPPTEAAVEACLEWALMPPDQLIGIEPVRAQPANMIGVLAEPSMIEPGGPASAAAKLTPGVDDVSTTPG